MKYAIYRIFVRLFARWMRCDEQGYCRVHRLYDHGNLDDSDERGWDNCPCCDPNYTED